MICCASACVRGVSLPVDGSRRNSVRGHKEDGGVSVPLIMLSRNRTQLKQYSIPVFY